ncbi:MAG: hypothetical protein Ct9H90mP27_6940 [Gammaproteobacteria bacterium]|nr:MAG: hypothetical protein Ct9H90mP27_6940 [Gammaproteobacteria bacterium]
MLELIQKLFVEGEPDPEIYHSTIKALDSLSASDELERCLRLFEIELLASLGYEVNFGYEGASGAKFQSRITTNLLPIRGSTR